MCVRSETREIISQRQLQNPPTSSGEVRVDKAWLTDFFQTPLFFKKNFFKYLFTHLAVWGLFDRQDLQPSLQHARSLSCSMWDPVLWPGIEPGPLHWEHEVLDTGPPGKWWSTRHPLLFTWRRSWELSEEPGPFPWRTGKGSFVQLWNISVGELQWSGLQACKWERETGSQMILSLHFFFFK